MDVGDHVSHVGLTLLFLHSGADVFRKPRQSLCDRPLAPGEARAVWRRIGFPTFVEEDYCGVRSVTPRAFHLNWPELVSPYPPGLHVYTLPEAALFLSGFGEHAIASFSLVKFALVAVFVCSALSRLYAQRGRSRLVAWPLWIFLTFYWAMHGIYDGIAVLCVLEGLERAREEPTKGWAWLSLAVFLHYRALFFLPLMVWSLLRAAMAARAGGRRERVVFGGALALNAVSLGVLAVQFPAFSGLPRTNALLEPVPAVVFVVAAGVLIAFALYERSYLWALSLVWIAALLVTMRQIMPWHFLSLCPVIAAAKYARRPEAGGALAHAFLGLAAIAVHLPPLTR